MYTFYVKKSGYSISEHPKNSFVLMTDNWDDFNFVTLFHLFFKNHNGEHYVIGEIKIGFEGQKNKSHFEKPYPHATYKKLEEKFVKLPEKYFSLGQSPEFYEKLYSLFEGGVKGILEQLNDVTLKPEIAEEYIKQYENEEDIKQSEKVKVFNISLLRTVDLWQIKNQFNPIVNGRSKLTNYHFRYNYNKKQLDFDVIATSNPPTNIHAFIGRNGVGKTTILNEMFQSLLKENEEESYTEKRAFNIYEPIEKDYFSKAIYISYGIFGDYVPDIKNTNDFSYIGLKQRLDGNDVHEFYLKRLEQLSQEFITSLSKIKSNHSLKKMFESALDKFLESYEENDIDTLKNVNDDKEIKKLFLSLSSGHAIVLLVISNLIANVIEKTLVLFDEPETHLHPPLLSALVRVINDILIEKNGICIFATHSPVVLQEIPKSCVNVIHRVGNSINIGKLDTESFGENVSTLTHQVFSLEVRNTGFYNMLKAHFEEKKSIEEIKSLYKNQLGSEALSLLYLLEHNNLANLNNYPEL